MLPSFPLSVCALEQLDQALSLGARLALDAQLGVDLVDILPDAALGEIQLFRDLAVAQALRHQSDDRAFALGQRGEHRGPLRRRTPLAGQSAQTDDAPGQAVLKPFGQQRLKIAEVLRERERKAVRLCVRAVK